MKVTELVYIGIKGSVIALHKTTGRQIWAVHLKGSSFVNAVAHQDKVYATTYGEVFCLDAITGATLWHNNLSGFGFGLSTIAFVDMQSSGAIPPVIQEHFQEEQQNSASAPISTPTINQI